MSELGTETLYVYTSIVYVISLALYIIYIYSFCLLFCVMCLCMFFVHSVNVLQSVHLVSLTLPYLIKSRGIIVPVSSLSGELCMCVHVHV